MTTKMNEQANPYITVTRNGANMNLSSLLELKTSDVLEIEGQGEVMYDGIADQQTKERALFAMIGTDEQSRPVAYMLDIKVKSLTPTIKGSIKIDGEISKTEYKSSHAMYAAIHKGIKRAKKGVRK